MRVSEYFPVWDELSAEQQNKLNSAAIWHSVKKGAMIHGGTEECLGLLLICSGQLRAYICSEEGREITLYRLFERDICLFSASCVMNNIQFTLSIEAEKDTDFRVIPPGIYRSMMEKSAPLANYTNQIMSARFSEVMWLMEQIMWKRMDQRVAAFLLEESSIEDTSSLKLTHETIANHLGTHREVITRLLRYFQNEGAVRLHRGTIELADVKILKEIAEK